MKVDWAVIAEAANFSQDRVNLLGVFRRIHFTSVPAVCPQLVLAISLIVMPEDLKRPHTVTVRLRNPVGGMSDVLLHQGIDLPYNEVWKENGDANLLLNGTGVVFDRFGVYAFHLSIDGEIFQELPLDIRPMPLYKPSPPADSSRLGDGPGGTTA